MALGPLLTQLLTRYGLKSLIFWASNQIILGSSPEEIELQLYDRPEFNARFPAIRARETAGLPPLSVDDYLNYESAVSELSNLWGIPLSKTEVDTLLVNDISAREVEERFNIAGTAVFNTTEEDRQAMEDLYGITAGRLAKYWMDPKKELAALEQEYVASRIAGGALRSGYGAITRTQAERLYDTGLTGEEATGAFGELFGMRGLFEAIDEVEEDIGQEEQIGLLAGEADVAEQVSQRAEKRIAEFEGGGEFAASGEGFKGIGAATS